MERTLAKFNSPPYQPINLPPGRFTLRNTNLGSQPVLLFQPMLHTPVIPLNKILIISTPISRSTSSSNVPTIDSDPIKSLRSDNSFKSPEALVAHESKEKTSDESRVMHEVRKENTADCCERDSCSGICDHGEYRTVNCLDEKVIIPNEVILNDCNTLANPVPVKCFANVSNVPRRPAILRTCSKNHTSSMASTIRYPLVPLEMLVGPHKIAPVTLTTTTSALSSTSSDSAATLATTTYADRAHSNNSCPLTNNDSSNESGRGKSILGDVSSPRIPAVATACTYTSPVISYVLSPSLAKQTSPAISPVIPPSLAKQPNPVISPVMSSLAKQTSPVISSVMSLSLVKQVSPVISSVMLPSLAEQPSPVFSTVMSPSLTEQLNPVISSVTFSAEQPSPVLSTVISPSLTVQSRPIFSSVMSLSLATRPSPIISSVISLAAQPQDPHPMKIKSTPRHCDAIPNENNIGETPTSCPLEQLSKPDVDSLPRMNTIQINEVGSLFDGEVVRSASNNHLGIEIVSVRSLNTENSMVITGYESLAGTAAAEGSKILTEFKPLINHVKVQNALHSQSTSARDSVVDQSSSGSELTRRLGSDTCLETENVGKVDESGSVDASISRKRLSSPDRSCGISKSLRTDFPSHSCRDTKSCYVLLRRSKYFDKPINVRRLRYLLRDRCTKSCRYLFQIDTVSCNL